MTDPTLFIVIDSRIGRIGRFCWVNSDLSGDPRRGQLGQFESRAYKFRPGACR